MQFFFTFCVILQAAFLTIGFSAALLSLQQHSVFFPFFDITIVMNSLENIVAQYEAANNATSSKRGNNKSTILMDSVLLNIVMECDINGIKMYLDQYPEAVDVFYNYSDQSDSAESDVITPLLLAVKIGSLAMVSVLITEYHANVNTCLPVEKYSPLFIACSKNFVAIVGFLLKIGNADITISDKVLIALLSLSLLC